MANAVAFRRKGFSTRRYPVACFLEEVRQQNFTPSERSRSVSSEQKSLFLRVGKKLNAKSLKPENSCKEAS
ncbi:hypothetical protein [Anabaena sp. CCY 9910]|uniref:hypothetical protein n=1 Tax=Anabaena sp. CCY 9910 TaxID=3103870 RepID=UPI0039E0156E